MNYKILKCITMISIVTFNVFNGVSFAKNANVFSARKCESFSIYVLIDKKSHLDRKCVMTTGVINVGQEWSYLYVNKESDKHSVYFNALAIGFTEEQRKILEQYNGLYITVTGIYDNASNSLSDVEFFNFK